MRDHQSSRATCLHYLHPSMYTFIAVSATCTSPKRSTSNDLTLMATRNRAQNKSSIAFLLFSLAYQFFYALRFSLATQWIIPTPSLGGGELEHVTSENYQNYCASNRCLLSCMQRELVDSRETCSCKQCAYVVEEKEQESTSLHVFLLPWRILLMRAHEEKTCWRWPPLSPNVGE